MVGLAWTISICDAADAAPDAQAPLIIYTDIVSGPNTGGEGNKGIYLSIFGKDLGSFPDLGVTTKVYIGEAEVEDYRSLGASRGRPDIQQLTVQVGSLGNPRMGSALPIKVAVGGRMAGNPNALTFTVNPGNIYFVSLSGRDSNDGTVPSPYRAVQKPGINNNGRAGCPAAAGDQPVATAGVWGVVHPGDFIIMRGGRWTDISKDDFFLRVQNKSGSAPAGTVGTGPITIMGYPGEDVFIDRTNTSDNQRGGGISSADTARQRLGCGAWVTITNVKVESGFNDGIIATQRGADNPSGSHWRVVNNEMTAVSCQYNTRCKGAGVSGSGAGGYWVGNHVHDVHDMPGNSTNFENHGFYADGIGSYEIAYNLIENIYGGNGVQLYSTTSPKTNNARIHHNTIRNVGKHGINLADGSGTGIEVLNNLVYDLDGAGLRINSRDLLGAKIYHNTFYNTDRKGKGGSLAALMNDWTLNSGAVEIRNNIFVPNGRARNYIGGTVGFGDGAVISNNLWHEGRGSVAIDTHPVLANPRFVRAGTDFHLMRGSLAVDAGSPAASGLVSNDFDVSTSRSQGKGFDLGAYELRP